MDPRIREHAEVVTDHSLSIEAGDQVVVTVPPAAEDMGVALYERLGDLGAVPALLSGGSSIQGTDRALRGYLTATDEYQTPEHLLALAEASDAIIRVRAFDNVTEQSDVPLERKTEFRKAYRPIQEEMLSTEWCLTQFPTDASAQLANMSTEGYENFVWDAINKDWDEQREFQAQMVEILDDADEVHIVSGDETDIRMSVDSMIPLNDYGEKNLPGGEVFTAPVVDSVEGEVLFDMPLYHEGREVQNARLAFENGEVVSHSATQNEAVLTEILETDDGARRLGELGIGMNRDIDQFTYNMLFDEKMGDTVHMAVGRAYPETVGENREVNESTTHVDMIVDMSEDSYIEIDGEVVQRDGTFVFEDDF